MKLNKLEKSQEYLRTYRESYLNNDPNNKTIFQQFDQDILPENDVF